MTPEPDWQTWRDRSWRHRLAYELAGVAAIGALLATLFILGDLVVYGTVRW